MSEKIKVSQEVADFIKGVEEHYMFSGTWQDNLLNDHEDAIENNWKRVKNEALCMKQYSLIQLREILKNGYEVVLMSQPIKITQEVLDVIKSSDNGDVYWEDRLVFHHAQEFFEGFKNVSPEAMCLKDFSPLELAQILLGNYEIKQTKEEHWTQEYFSAKSKAEAYALEYNQDGESFNRGVYITIAEMARDFNIKLKGVNC